MLEVLFIVIFIVACFVAIGWYAIQRTKKNNHAFLTDLAQRMEPELKGGEEFTSILQEELKQQIQIQATDVEAEPAITLSEQAKQQITEPSTDISEHIKRSNRTTSIDHTEDDLSLDEVLSPESAEYPQQQQAATEAEPILQDWDMVIAFTVVAKDGQKFVGSDLKTLLEGLGLSFDEMGIYHRMTTGAHKQTLFSIANIIDPGTFTPDNPAEMTTPGILIFATLPGPVNGLMLFDDVLETAQHLTEKLDGILSDESREPLTQASIEAMRSRILALNFSLQTEQR